MLLIAGFLTRFFSLAVMIDMAVAIWKIHWKNGMFGKGGYEFPLTLATVAFALIFSVPVRSRSMPYAAVVEAPGPRKLDLSRRFLCDLCVLRG